MKVLQVMTNSIPSPAEMLERLEANAELIGQFQGLYKGTAIPPQEYAALRVLREANRHYREQILAACVTPTAVQRSRLEQQLEDVRSGRHAIAWEFIPGWTPETQKAIDAAVAAHRATNPRHNETDKEK